MADTFIRTLRPKVCPEAYRWLNAAAVEVNQVYNYANEISYATATRTDLKRKWLSGFDLCSLTAFQVVNEKNTTRECSNCRALTGPSGLRHLAVRQWVCVNCGESHDRDVNSARNILIAGSRCGTSVSGNESSPEERAPSQISDLREAGSHALQAAA
jgi:hypothetical protein